MVYHRTSENLREAAEFQFQSLQVSARAFDEGLKGEAARLATTVFILVGRGMRHHTSILDAAGQQEKRRYRSTFSKADQEGSPLIQIKLEKVSEKEWTIAIQPRGKLALMEGRDVSFDEWWSEPVINNNKHSLSRDEVVRILRDKNGGAHFDISVKDKLVADALKGDIGAFYYKSKDGEERPVKWGLENCMRQIVEELWFSMQNS